MKLETMKVSGGEYAKVATRIKQFREDCPNGSIETKPTIEGDMIIFTTTVIKDLSNPSSARATGSALSKIGKIKEFEKTESISVGRALALLGYLASGEIASSEEMEEFLSEKEQRKIEQLELAQEEINNVKTLEELTAVYKKYEGLGKELVVMCSNKKKTL